MSTLIAIVVSLAIAAVVFNRCVVDTDGHAIARCAWLPGPVCTYIIPRDETVYSDIYDDIRDYVCRLGELRENGDTLFYSFVLQVSGVDSDGYCSETSIRDVERAFEDLSIDVERTEPNDSEYAYLVTEEYGDSPRFVEAHHTEIDARDDGSRDDVLFAPARGFIVDERTRSSWWGVQDIQVSGVLNSDDLETLCCAIGASATDENTMGTLGGPLSCGLPTIVPDIVFRIESPILIDSIRVTPFDPTWSQDHTVTEDEWNTLRDRVIARFGY